MKKTPQNFLSNLDDPRGFRVLFSLLGPFCPSFQLWPLHSLRQHALTETSDNLAPLAANTQCLAGCSLPQPAPAPVLRCWSSWKHQVGPAEAMSTALAARREELLPWGNNSPWQPAEPRLWQGSWKPTPAKTRLLAPLWLLRVTQFKTKI